MRRALVVALVAVFGICGASAATTFYTSPTGDGLWPCIQSDPCPLQNAINLATAGDTVWLAAGTYDDHFYSYADGTAANPIWIKGPATAIIDAPDDANHPEWPAVQIDDDYIIVEGITIKEATWSDRDYLIWVLGTTGVVIRDVSLEGEAVLICMIANNNDDLEVDNLDTRDADCGAADPNNIYHGSAFAAIDLQDSWLHDGHYKGSRFGIVLHWGSDDNIIGDVTAWNTDPNTTVGAAIWLDDYNPFPPYTDDPPNGNIISECDLDDSRVGVVLYGTSTDITIGTVSGQTCGVQFEYASQGAVCGNYATGNTDDECGTYEASFDINSSCGGGGGCGGS